MFDTTITPFKATHHKTEIYFCKFFIVGVMDELKFIELEKIVISPFQPRKSFQTDELDELSQSIKTVGIIHPPTVRQIGEDSYELVSGERRLRASKLAGLFQIPVFVKQTSHIDSAHAALIENIQRVDLNPLEIAVALKRLLEEFNYSQEDLSQKVGKKRSTVANYLRLLSLPSVIQGSLKDEAITMGHAKAILSLAAIDQQLALHSWILRQSLSVRDAEEAARTISEKKCRPKPAQQEDIFLREISRKLSEKLSTRVSIEEASGKGTLSLHFYSYDDLDRLLEYFE